MPSRTVDRAQLRRLVDGAKKNRKNRMYYEKYFNVTDVKKAGIIPSEEQSNLDRLTLDLNRNESIHLFGFDQSGSYFDLQITVVSLFASSVGLKKATESKWRLGNLDFVYYNTEKKYKYSYNCEELLDYDERRNHADKHESRNLLKIGSLSLETVLPFSISRILINGLVTVEDLKDGPSSGQLIPIRLNISLHPTCDKFDYSYLFSKKYLVNALEASADDQNSPEHLLELLLEDRFDQALMFQGHLEKLRTIHDKDEPAKDEQFIMWGAKCKKFLDADKPTSELERSFERLYVWAESGQQIHLSRPRRSNLINGMVHNSFDYASPLGDVKLFEGDEEIPFSKLGSFNELSSNHKIKLVGFKNKQYSVEFLGRFESQQPIVSKINGFDGFAATCEDNLAERCREAQKKLWTLVIGDRLVASKLANESLLGGKGNSLIDLARCSSEGQPLSCSSYNSRRVGVSVPRGFIVTCVAYKLWLESEPKILEAINELDCKRRSLSAQSIYLNPMSPKHNSVLRVQQILREQCAKTCSVLNSCPLPEQLRGHISSQLLELFGDKVEAGKMFAVRSSAVGEDSLETSAAGQMRTILDAQGLDSICKSIVECWSSQFELEAVTYKTQNGLAFNLPMAVVVQELIQCKVAGVAATCDPLNGNKNQLEITANVGLGEGVVSGKQTDTVRVSLVGLRWDPKEEDHMGLLSLRDVEDQVQKISGEAGCCLDDKQIISLSNLLLKLRRLNPIKEREVEWGITMTDVDSSSSSSSSSSSDDDDDDASFAIHLLQSRPLTHLQRLATREVDHELDYGHPSAMDIVSRANLGEVMPGALSTLNASYYQTITTTYATHKPYQAHHSRCPYVADSFGFHSGMAVMVVSYSDTVARFSRFGDSGGTSDGVQMAKAAIYSMIGSTFDQPEDETLRKKLERFYEEKLNPNSKIRNKGLAHILGLDLSYSTARMSLEFGLKRLKFVDEAQKALDHLIEVTWRCPKESKTNELNQSIRRLYKKLITETSLMSKSWMLHIGATIVSMSFNFMCLKLLSSQPAYAGMDVISSEILNDFSVLIGGGARSETLGEQTESGDISLLLNRLLESFLQEGQLELAKTLDQQKLYEYLADKKSSLQSSRLFREFIQRNGHRAYKEFCMATRTWSDDCSYIIRLLSMRLKTFSADEADRERKRRQQVAEQRQKRLAEVEAKVVRTRFLLMKYAIPKAQQATIRRERSKSLTIEVVHKFRLAFRYLGGLLCLAGRLPNAELIFFISIQELDEIIGGLSLDDDHDHRADLSRIIYKARRRQQRARAFEKVKFPRPTMEFHDMVATIREQVAGGTNSGTQQGPTTTTTTTSNGLLTGPPTGARHQVKGLTSCGGCVTGRACVVSSLDEMDQIQENDILVTYSIDISWSVYFFALAGIVTEVGGIVSHGAVVAREYGIPTLCTALGACSAFTTGQLITLDADKGVCYLAEVAEVAGVAEVAAADDHH